MVETRSGKMQDPAQERIQAEESAKPQPGATIGRDASSDPVVLNPNIDIPKYDGTEDPRPWIESLEEIGFLYHWAEYIISRYAAMNMIGSAKTWLDLHKISFTSWEHFKSRLIQDFGSDANKEELKMRLNRMQQWNEPAIRFAEDILVLCNKVDPQMEEENKINWVIGGLKKEYSFALYLNPPKNTNELLRLCKKMDLFENNYQERIEKSKALYNGPRSPRSHHQEQWKNAPSFRRPDQNTSKPQAPAPRYYQNTPKPQAPAQRYYQNKPLPQVSAPRRFYTPIHEPKPVYPRKTYNKSPDSNRNRTEDGRPICFKCNKPGHVARYCRVKASIEAEDGEYVIEENNRMTQTNGLRLARSLLTVTDKKTHIWITNPYPRPLKIMKDQTLAYGSLPAGVNFIENKEKQNENDEIQFQINKNLSFKEQERLEQILAKYTDLFSSGLGRTNLAKHQIHTEDAKPIKHKPYRVSAKERTIIKDQIDEMLEEGIIRQSSSPWSFPVILVKKRDGKYRFCVDYRKLNEVTVKDVYPIPRIDDVMDTLQGSKYFSAIDLKSGYWQVEIEERDKEKTAFTTAHGLYEFNVMPFGLCNAPATFERNMDNVLGNLRWQICLCYLDDVIIYSSDFPTHIKRLEAVLRCFSESNLKLNAKKCRFAFEELEILGHITNQEGIKPAEYNIKAVRDFPQPKKAKEVQSFLGMCSYYRKFIKDFSLIADPLTSLIRKNVQIIWTGKQEEAFQNLKKALMNPPILGHFDPNAATCIHTDASNIGLGATLIQNIGGEEKVISYLSRTLSKPEQNYSTTEKECLAVVWSISKLRPYLYGRNFKIVTDHHALCWLKNLKDPTGRLARWALKIQEYNFEIIHKSGKKHLDADGLSRGPLPENEWDEDYERLFLNQIIDEKDDFIENIKENLSGNKRSITQNFKEENGCLYKKNPNPEGREWLLVVPKKRRKEIMSEYHNHMLNGHLGVARTTYRLKNKYYWPSMLKDVSEFVKTCHLCQSRKGSNQLPSGLLQPIPPANYPFERIGIDFVGPLPSTKRRRKWIIVLADYYTKYAETKAVPEATVKEVSTFLIEHIFLRHGAPRFLISDRGSQFTSNLMKEVMKMCKVKHCFTTSYHPQTNGLTERLNRTLINMISMYVNMDQKNWDEILPFITHAYNTTIQETTGYSPFFLLFGREPMSLLDDENIPTDSNMDDYDEYIENYLDKIARTRQVVINNTEKTQERMKRNYDKKHNERIYEPGHLVAVWTPVRKIGKCEKLLRKYFGPYRILKKLSNVNYLIEPKDNPGQDPLIVHVSRIKPYFERIDEVNHEDFHFARIRYKLDDVTISALVARLSDQGLEPRPDLAGGEVPRGCDELHPEGHGALAAIRQFQHRTSRQRTVIHKTENAHLVERFKNKNVAFGAIGRIRRKKMAENPNNRLQKFNGSKSAIRPESWIKLYDFENNSLKEDEKIKNLMYYLTDSALEWYADEIISNPAIKRWEVVKEKLIQRFGSYNANPIVSASHRRLKREESIENYFQDKIRLLNQTHLTKEEKIHLLTDGLPNDWKDLIVAAQPTDTTKWFHIAASIEQNRASIQFKPKNKIHLATKNNDNRKNVCPFWCPICSKKGIKIKHWVTDCEDYDPNYKKGRPNQNTSVKQVCGAPELLNVSTLTNTPTQGAFKLINISVEVNGIPAQAFVDTGATVSIINWRLFKRTRLQLQPNSDIHISQADGVTRTCGSLQTKVRIDKLIKPVTLHVMKNFKYPLLIGLDVASLFNLLIDVRDKTIYTKFDGLQNPILVNHLEEIREHELKKILEHNRNVFSQHAIDLGKVAIQHKIITKSEQPISLRPYRRPLKEYEEIAEQVKELLKHKLIRISDSPWAFPVVMVPKKDGNKRMCIDYRRLNEITLDDRQPLPHIQDMFDRLHGSRFFSTLDVAWGYWQIEMDPQSIQKTAFVTNDGPYEFLVMPFGLKNAASTFQRIIQHILGELLWKGTCSFQDDILVYTKTWQEHIELLSKVFDKLRQYNMKLKLSKCIFGRTEVKYLGHIISHNQLKPDPGKVKSIQDFPRPDTVKKVRQFMGLANYYRKFVKDFSKISFPLVRLTRKNQPFIWNEEVEESFAKLKMALSTKPVLAIYNPDYPSKVYTDASKYGIGAILTQIGPDNEEHVIAYYSKTLQPHQENYSAYEMECLAVIQATDHFHVYIENQPFEIITDHAALQWLFTMKKPKPKYFRWILSLSSKSCNIVHRSGKQQTHVDALSRLPVVNIATQELQEHQQNSDLSFLKNSHTHDGVVMIKQRGVFKAVVPNSLTKKILEEYHDSLSHPSITKTCKLITQCYWWKGITTDIKNYVRSCKSCQLVKVRHEPTLGEMITPTSNIQPLQMIGCDTIVLGTAAANTKHKFIQVFVDHATRYLWAYPTIKNTAQAVTQCLDKIIKSVNSINTILTDNGKNFISKEFNKFLSLQGIKHTYTSPYHPQCNGICEKLNDTIMTKLRIAVLEKPRCKWSTLLPQVVKNYNSTPHDVTGFSPLFLMYGIGNVPEFADQTPITIEEARKKASLRTEQSRSKWKIKHDSHHPNHIHVKCNSTCVRSVVMKSNREFENRAAIIVALRAGRSPKEIVDFLKLPKTTIYRVKKQFDEADSNKEGIATRKKHSRRSDRVRDEEFVKNVKEKIDGNPGKSMRAIAKEMDVGSMTIVRTIHEDLGLKSYALRKGQLLTENMKNNRKGKAAALLNNLKHDSFGMLRFFSDEKNFDVNQKVNPRNDRWICKDPSEIPVVMHTKFPASVMVLGVISSEGDVMPPHFFEKGLRMNADTYINVLETVVKPWMDMVAAGRKYVFQQDSAPAHKAKKTQSWLTLNVPSHWGPDIWPPNSPDCNPLDYYVWGVVERDVNKAPPTTIQSVKKAVHTVMTQMDK
ncbi:hypothetical protein LAZ67_18001842, partial [Cordylochernes scorpioides]